MPNARSWNPLERGRRAFAPPHLAAAQYSQQEILDALRSHKPVFVRIGAPGDDTIVGLEPLRGSSEGIVVVTTSDDIRAGRSPQYVALDAEAITVFAEPGRGRLQVGSVQGTIRSLETGYRSRLAKERSRRLVHAPYCVSNINAIDAFVSGDGHHARVDLLLANGEIQSYSRRPDGSFTVLRIDPKHGPIHATAEPVRELSGPDSLMELHVRTATGRVPGSPIVAAVVGIDFEHAALSAHVDSCAIAPARVRSSSTPTQEHSR